ncbi:MAG: FAD-dependent oxidoreductase [Opitutus sp.]|nr:FAD-dependent oxidoreductase [Opitutus sp.]
MYTSGETKDGASSESPAEFALAVFGATAPGIVAAVRAARAGLSVALVSPHVDLGASFPSLGAVETHYRGVRAPLLQEFVERVIAHYRAHPGKGDEALRACTGGMIITFEPHVAERILTGWIAAEQRIQLWLGWELIGVERQGAAVTALRLRQSAGDRETRIMAEAFVEATDEGDLLAQAGAAFRVGRESRAEFGEPRAGRVFTRWMPGRFPTAAVAGRLALTTAGATTSDPLPGSTGVGDDNIQSYSYRLCLTDDPENRRRLESPPSGYDREHFAPILLPPEEKERLALPFHHRFLIYSLREMVARDHIFHGHALPNRKRSWNATNLTGGGRGYASADAAGRRAIERAHREHALGLMWFLQNDPAIPPDLRELAGAWGLARDEFVATDNFPPHLYVREARRLVGRAIFTEHDALLAAPPATSNVCHPLDDKPVCHLMDDNQRAPPHADAVGITEFSLDSLACTTERLPGAGALCDGQLFQMEVSRPGQVPWGVLLPREINNLAVVTTMSATHVGWGTIRQTPTQMHLAESAAWAVVLANRARVLPADIGIDLLQRHLVAHGVMISFFNDCDMAGPAAWTTAFQFLGARGFFPTYDAHPAEAITPATAEAWHRLAPPVAASRLNGLSRAAGAELVFCALTEPGSTAAVVPVPVSVNSTLQP